MSEEEPRQLTSDCPAEVVLTRPRLRWFDRVRKYKVVVNGVGLGLGHEAHGSRRVTGLELVTNDVAERFVGHQDGLPNLDPHPLVG